MSTRTSRATNGVLTSFLQYGLQVILQATLAPLVLRVAGQETLGAYSILLQVVGYVALLDFGFGVSLSRFLSQAFGLHDRGVHFAKVFGTARVFFFCSNTAFAVLIGVLGFYLGDLFPMTPHLISQARIALSLIAIWAILRTPISLYANGLIATQNLAVANVIAIVGNAVRLILSLGLVYMGADLVGLILANIISEALTYGLQFIYFRKLYPDQRFPWKIFDISLLKEMMGFGIQYFGVNLACRLFYNTDNLVVGYLYGAAAASVYYVTQMPAFLSFQLIWKISDNAAPAVNELYAQGNRSNFRAAYLRIMRYSLLFTIPLAVGIVGFNKVFVVLWVGISQYAGDIMSVSLAIFVVSQVVNHINAMLVVASGEMRWWAGISVLSGFLNLFLSVWLGKMFGMQWVMVASALADIPLTIYLFRRGLDVGNITGSELWTEAIRAPLIASIPVMFFALLFRLSSMAPSVVTVGYVLLGFAICWGIGGIKVGLNSSERESVLAYVRTRFSELRV